MATLSIQAAAGTTVTRTKTVSGADLLRLVAWYRAVTNEPVLTNDQIIGNWMDSVFAETKQRIRQYEDAVAMQSAQSGGSDISLT